MIYTLATYNLMRYRRRAQHDDRDRLHLVEQTIRDVNPDVIAIQGVPGESPRAVVDGLCRLAAMTRMDCTISTGGLGQPSVYAVAPGGHDDLGVGIMWRPGIRPLSQTWRVIDGRHLWYAFATIALDVGDRQITFASYHAPPLERRVERLGEARILAGMLTAGTTPPGFVGGTWSSPSARRVGAGRFFDPSPVQEADSSDRDPDRVLEDAGLIDTAIAAHAHWAPTAGHWPDDRDGSRRVDRILANVAAAACVVDDSYSVVNTPQARAASDHLPVLVTYRAPESGNGNDEELRDVDFLSGRARNLRLSKQGKPNGHA